MTLLPWAPCQMLEAKPLKRRAALPSYSGDDPFVTQCGLRDQSQHVELYDGSLRVSADYVSKHQASTVLIRWKTKQQIIAAMRSAGFQDPDAGNVASTDWCSATLISDSLLLTAGHCLTAMDGEYGWITPTSWPEDRPRPLTPGQFVPLMEVAFLYQLDKVSGAPHPSRTYPLAKLVEHGFDELQALDFAIIEFARPDGFPAIEAARLSKAEPQPGQIVAVIQHPDAFDGKKLKKVNAGSILKIEAQRLHYNDIDTLNSSSGSAVRNLDGEVVGVHIEGGCKETGHGTNKAIPLSDISKVSPTIRHLRKD